MAYFYSLRGWLEVEPDHLQSIVRELRLVQENSFLETNLKEYTKAWCWREETLNWTSYLFYGADVNPDGLDLFEDTLSRIIDLRLEVSGFFHAQGEDGERNHRYIINIDDLEILPDDNLLDT